jgi:hypothetical protein
MNILPPPGPARTRQLALLAIALVALAVVGWRYLGTSVGPATARPSTSNTQARTAQTSDPAKAALPEPVDLGKLEPVPDAPVTSRNPFRFGTPPAPPPQPRVEAPPVVRPPAPVVPAGPPPPPPIPLKFIGRVVLPDRRVVAALSDTKGGVFEVTEGQIVDGRYRVVKIGEESVIIEYLNGTGRMTLGLR